MVQIVASPFWEVESINFTPFESNFTPFTPFGPRNNTDERNMTETICQVLGTCAKRLPESTSNSLEHSLGAVSLPVRSLTMQKRPLIGTMVDYLSSAQSFDHPCPGIRHVSEAAMDPPDENICPWIAHNELYPC